MNNVPHWMLSALKSTKLRCHKCHNIFNSSQLRALGIRDSYHEEGKETLFIELICSKCSEMTLYELQDMSLVELAFDILDDIEEDVDIIQKEKHGSSIEELSINEDKSGLSKKKIIKKKISKINKSKISLKEIKDSVKLLQSLKTHEDFLIELGYSPEEIEKFNIKKDKR